MGRKKGSRDLKPRKTRKDRKHKYVHRKGKLVPYIPKRQRTDPIKIRFAQKVPMSEEGYRSFPRQVRPYVHKFVYLWLFRADVDSENLSNKEAIGELALELIGYEGEFIMFGFSHGKNKYRVKPVKLCRITITSTQTGLRAEVYDTWRLARYWFWRGG